MKPIVMLIIVYCLQLTKLYSDIPKTLLREHYRCHPKIIGFCNKKFYNNELIILTNESLEDKPLSSI